MKPSRFPFILLAFGILFAETEPEVLLESEGGETARLARGIQEEFEDLRESLHARVSALEKRGRESGDLNLWLWSTWAREDMESTGNGLHWLQERVEYPPELERFRTEAARKVQELLEAAAQKEEQRLHLARERFRGHVGARVGQGRIDEAVRARDVFAGHEALPEFRQLRETVDALHDATSPVARIPEDPRVLRMLPPGAGVYFQGDAPAYQAFLQRVSAISSGHLGVRASGIRVEGHPDFVGRRGINVLALEGNRELLRDHFDTYKSEEESERFAEAVAELPPGVMVVVVFHDDGSRKLTPEARASLVHLGAGDGLHGLAYRDAYLLIGMKGLAHGQAVEWGGLGERMYKGTAPQPDEDLK